MTTFQSTELLSHVMHASGGFSRMHQFEADITPPSSMMFDRNTLERIGINCHTTALPGRAFATKDDSQGGVLNREIPHSVIFQPLQMMFYLSDDLAEKKFFDEWQGLVIEDGFGALEYYENYIGTIMLHKHSKKGDPSSANGQKPIASYRLLECYPKMVGDIQLSYMGENQIAMLPVTMAYWRWEDGADDSPPESVAPTS